MQELSRAMEGSWTVSLTYHVDNRMKTVEGNIVKFDPLNDIPFVETKKGEQRLSVRNIINVYCLE
ncbi:YolD-like family protein [Paenibacillus sophorae]|uniref:YolD-like family protein n=1 Tax=Paenibacillus sophorae TaxID=1333845 RepID=UPI003CCE96BE